MFVKNCFDGEIVPLKWRESTFESAERSPFHDNKDRDVIRVLCLSNDDDDAEYDA